MLWLGMVAALATGETGTATTVEVGAVTAAREITINKNYQVYVVDPEDKNPVEDITFTIAYDASSGDGDYTTDASLANLVTFDNDELSKAFLMSALGVTGTAATLTVKVPAAVSFPGVGVYVWKITETPGNKAGVTYDNHVVYLKITVTCDNTAAGAGTLYTSYAIHYASSGGSKIGGSNASQAGGSGTSQTGGGGAGQDAGFTNTYKSGRLTVRKTVSGNLGDRSKDFDVSVKLEGTTGLDYADITVASDLSTRAASSIPVDGEAHTFRFRHGETLTFKNIPEGVRYTVTEPAVTGYTTTIGTEAKNEVTGTIGGENKAPSVTFNNEKTDSIDTGVALDTVPYIILLAAVVLGACLSIARKRRED